MPNALPHDEWEALTNMIAAAVVRAQSPASDMISQTVAERDFGYTWLHSMVNQGKAKRFYPDGVQNGRNGKIMYSRHQLSCLWAETHNIRPNFIYTK